MSKKIRSTMRKGFHMTFKNGVTASIQWGAGNYCDNQYDFDFSFSEDAKSNTAEVSALDSRGEFITEEVAQSMINLDYDNSVIGYLSPEKIVDFLVLCRDYAPKCSFEDSGLKPCEVQAMDCGSCEYHNDKEDE